MLPTFELDRVTVHAGQTVAVLAKGDAAHARALIWPVWQRIVAHFAEVAVGDVMITRTMAGKPMLAPSAGLRFNASYGARHSLLAVSRSGHLGCDVEDRLLPEDGERLGAVVLHQAEAARMGALAPHQRPRAFARCWVRKEAILKANGTGFGEDPRKFDVRPTDEEPNLNVEGWWLHDLPGADVAAAVASRDRACAWFVL
jgi:phosphopantetheinyl transferase